MKISICRITAKLFMLIYVVSDLCITELLPFLCAGWGALPVSTIKTLILRFCHSNKISQYQNFQESLFQCKCILVERSWAISTFRHNFKKTNLLQRYLLDNTKPFYIFLNKQIISYSCNGESKPFNTVLLLAALKMFVEVLCQVETLLIILE